MDGVLEFVSANTVVASPLTAADLDDGSDVDEELHGFEFGDLELEKFGFDEEDLP
jgi:hypothetical protein